MKKQILLLLILLTGLLPVLEAQQWITAEDSLKAEADFIDDDLIVATLDSLNNVKYFENTENALNQLQRNKYNFLPNFTPTYHDSVYYYRMQQLDVNSPIDLNYNQIVKTFIDLYAVKKRGTTSRVLGLAQTYFPLFEQYLDMYDIPLELKYLAIVESALNAEAKSRVGATGLWQFMYHTGKVYGLEVTSFVDDRNDPIKSTIAACRHFRDLFNMYHDWQLVLAAYNSGPGNVNKAIRRSGGKMSFWELRPYLPRETRDYVPAFIAVNYVMNYSQEHNLYPVLPRITYHETDTVSVTQPLSLAAVSEKLKIPLDELTYLNPTYRKGFIPASPQNPYSIRLPIKSVADYINNQESLYALNKLKAYEAPQYAAAGVEGDYEIITKKITHKVRSGENISGIARKYDCTTQEIKKWNRLKKSSLYKGQKLAVYVKTKRPIPAQKQPEPEQQTAQAAGDTLVNSQESEKPVAVKTVSVEKKVPARYHTVKSGESLSKIAGKYNVSMDNLKQWNKMKNTKLMAGQKLRVNAPVVIVKEQLAEADTNKVKTEEQVAVKENDANEKLVFHTVQSGDTLWSIARKYQGVTVTQIREWNNLTNKQPLKVGQKIKVILPGT